MQMVACKAFVQLFNGFLLLIGSLTIQSYVNAISEVGSNEPPPQLHGGIIADPMGLGKILTMIALAATGLSLGSIQGHPSQAGDAAEHQRPVLATLIIVPPPREYLFQHPQTSTC